ncbi:MAG: ArgE/DapE family deacylase [Pseudomonadota bacterium]
MPLDPSLAHDITQAVSDGFDAQVALTQELVRCPSQRGAEQTAQDVIAREMRALDLPIDRFAMDRDRIAAHPGGSKITDAHSDVPILVATHHPESETGRSLILQAHVDVVPPGPADLWTRPPYDPVVEGDWMYGRGSADMKAGAAANVAVLRALWSLGIQPAATLHLQSVVEEESTGNGALMTHLRGYRGDACLIPEPEDEKLVRANTGVVWFTVDVSGVAVHVREMGAGNNAIDAAYRVIGALRSLEAELNADRATHRHFETIDHPINLNIGRIEGGDWASSVPNWCRLHCRLSLYPGQSAAEIAARVEDTVSRFARDDAFLSNRPPVITFNGFFAEGYALEPGSDAEAVLASAHEQATGDPLESFVTPGYLDTRVHALYDHIPALCYGPIGENIHGVDERVNLASVKRITTAMALFVAAWCGVEKAGN